ncbi:MAG: hypothetical protein E7501_03500 [Ruminococcus sp.]|nr:hypothetical protein [Ruminococcus sp.]
MQLLKITTKPIEYKIEVEHASLKVAENKPADVLTQNAVKAVAPQTSQETARQVRRDPGFVHHVQATAPETAANLQAYNASMGTHASTAATAEYVAQQPESAAYSQNLDAALAQIPQAIDPSWEPKNANGVKDGKALENAKRQMEYTPGKVSIEVESRAEVEIEYLGSPRYVPPSSAPDYEPPEEE